jgi:hypothetical protein
MTTATATIEANTYQIRGRGDGYANLYASGLGCIGIVRRPQIVRDLYTADQLLAVGRIIGLSRDGLQGMLNAAE